MRLGSNVKSYGSHIRRYISYLLTWDSTGLYSDWLGYTLVIFIFFLSFLSLKKKNGETKKTTTAQGVQLSAGTGPTRIHTQHNRVKWHATAALVWGRIEFVCVGVCTTTPSCVGVGVMRPRRICISRETERTRERARVTLSFFSRLILRKLCALYPATLVAWFTIHDPAIRDVRGREGGAAMTPESTHKTRERRDSSLKKCPFRVQLR